MHQLRSGYDGTGPAEAYRRFARGPGSQAGSVTRTVRGAKNDNRFIAAQSINSRRPSWCSTKAVQLSTQSPSFRYKTPSTSRISAWWIWPHTTPSNPRRRASRANAVSNRLIALTASFTWRFSQAESDQYG